MTSLETPNDAGAAGAARFTSALAGSPKALLALAIVAVIVCCAMFSPFLAPYDPNLQSLVGRLQPPLSMTADGHLHLLGTDHLGRDLLSRLIYGARISLVVGIGASGVAGAIGVFFGLVSGYFVGLIDDAIMRLCEIQLALPYILLAIALLAIVGSGLFSIIVVLSLTQWVTYTRVVRASVLAEKDEALRDGRPRARPRKLADHVPPHPAERVRPGDRDRHLLGRVDDRGGIGAELFGPRCAGGDPELGQDAGRRPHLSRDRVVAHSGAGTCDHAHGDRS